MSVYSMMFMGMAPLGAFFAGAAAHKIGAPLTLALGGAASVAGAAVFALQLPKLRVSATQLILAQESAGVEPPETLTIQSPTVTADADISVLESTLTAGQNEGSGRG